MIRNSKLSDSDPEEEPGEIGDGGVTDGFHRVPTVVAAIGVREHVSREFENRVGEVTVEYNMCLWSGESKLRRLGPGSSTQRRKKDVGLLSCPHFLASFSDIKCLPQVCDPCKNVMKEPEGGAQGYSSSFRRYHRCKEPRMGTVLA